MSILTEFRQACRASLRSPGFVLLAALTLAVGIGASVAVLTLVDRVLLRPLPYEAPRELHAAGLVQQGGWTTITPQEYRALEGLPGVAAMGIATMQAGPVNLAEDVEPEIVQAFAADSGLLRTLGTPLQLGRGFNAEEDVPNGAAAVIISHQLWQRRFDGDPAVIGRTLDVEGMPTPIVGVLRADVRLTDRFDLMLPLRLPASTRDSGRNYLAILRVPGDVPAEVVAEGIRQRLRQVQQSNGDARFFAASLMGMQPLSSTVAAQSRPLLLLFLGCALCVLLLATVNLANLMLLRALARSRVGAVRRALGATGWRSVSPMLAEGTLVAVLGAVAGLALSRLALNQAAAWVPASWFAGGTALSPGAVGYGFALGAAALAAVGSALFAAWREGSGGSLMQAGNARSGPGVGASRLSRALVALQISLASLLLIGAALFARSLQEASHVDLGFEVEGRLTFEMSPVRARYPEAADVKLLAQTLTGHLAQLPGVRAVAAGTNLPIGAPLNYVMQLPSGEPFSVEFRGITPGYLETFGIPLRAGRDVRDSDDARGAPVVLVNDAFVRTYFGAEGAGAAAADVLDRELLMPVGDGQVRLRIAGVTGDTRQHGPEVAAPPIAFLPLAQLPDALFALIRDYAPLRVGLQVGDAPENHVRAVEAAVAEVAPGQPIAQMKPLASLAAESTSTTRLNLALIGTFAGLALLLATVGLYAVIAVATASREREFGVRLALGSTGGRVLALVLGDGLRQAAIGLTLGLVAAWALARIVQGFVPGVSATDPLAMTAALLIVAGVALLACTVPALRAARVSPVHAMREE
jgi:putative ABC transport system permease protein